MNIVFVILEMRDYQGDLTDVSAYYHSLSASAYALIWNILFVMLETHDDQGDLTAVLACYYSLFASACLLIPEDIICYNGNVRFSG